MRVASLRRKWNVGGLDWIDLTQEKEVWGALVNVVLTHQFTQNVGNLFTSLETVNFSRRHLLHEVSTKVAKFLNVYEGVQGLG